MEWWKITRHSVLLSRRGSGMCPLVRSLLHVCSLLQPRIRKTTDQTLTRSRGENVHSFLSNDPAFFFSFSFRGIRILHEFQLPSPPPTPTSTFLHSYSYITPFELTDLSRHCCCSWNNGLLIPPGALYLLLFNSDV